MSKRTVPSTSLEALKSLTPEQRQNHYKKILEALHILRAANYEKISTQCRLDRHAIGRRLKEMEGLGLIWRPGGKTPTSTGRNSFVWQLAAETEALQLPVEKSDKKAKSVATYSKKIKELSTPFIQPSLF